MTIIARKRFHAGEIAQYDAKLKALYGILPHVGPNDDCEVVRIAQEIKEGQEVIITYGKAYRQESGNG